MFKVLTNVRPSKTETPELSTTPTAGTMKLNSPAASHIKGNVGDYVTVIEDENPNSEFHGQWLMKCAVAVGDEAQVGSKLASTNKQNGGSLQFSSSNAYQALKGNDNTRVVYTIGDAVEHAEAGTIYKLTFSREETKTEKKKKEAVTA